MAKRSGQIPDKIPAAFRTDLGLHRLHFIPGGRILIVAFDHVGLALARSRDRQPWSSKFFRQEGHSVLGVMAFKPIWFRDARLHRALLDLKDQGFFDSFDRVVMTGSSMGGFAAAAFAPLAPGCTVLAFNPQSTLDRRLVPWERAYHSGRRADWSLGFGDAAVGAREAGQVYLIHDPHHPSDRPHALRFPPETTTLLAAPFLGHQLPETLRDLGALKTITRDGIAGTLTPLRVAELTRQRRSHPKYYREMIRHLTRRGRFAAALSLCDRARRTYDDPAFDAIQAVVLAAQGSSEEAFRFLYGKPVGRGRRAPVRRPSVQAPVLPRMSSVQRHPLAASNVRRGIALFRRVSAWLTRL